MYCPRQAGGWPGKWTCWGCCCCCSWCFHISTSCRTCGVLCGRRSGRCCCPEPCLRVAAFCSGGPPCCHRHCRQAWSATASSTRSAALVRSDSSSSRCYPATVPSASPSRTCRCLCARWSRGKSPQWSRKCSRRACPRSKRRQKSGTYGRN